MKFEVGHNKVGGRKKGTPNRKTLSALEIFERLNFEPLSELILLIPKLEPSDQAKVFIHLSSFIYPKRKAIEIDDVSAPRHKNLASLSSKELVILASQIPGVTIDRDAFKLD